MSPHEDGTPRRLPHAALAAPRPPTLNVEMSLQRARIAGRPARPRYVTQHWPRGGRGGRDGRGLVTGERANPGAGRITTLSIAGRACLTPQLLTEALCCHNGKQKHNRAQQQHRGTAHKLLRVFAIFFTHCNVKLSERFVKPSRYFVKLSRYFLKLLRYFLKLLRCNLKRCRYLRDSRNA